MNMPQTTLAVPHRRLLTVGLPLTLFLVLLLATGVTMLSTHAASVTCPKGVQAYRIVSGDTLKLIAKRYHTTVQTLASSNAIKNRDEIYIDQVICLTPTTVQTQKPLNSGKVGPGSSRNFFDLGQCTWWADERYYQLHGVFVPWRTNANAWQWVDRANDYGWHVSTTPTVGDIVVMQPFTPISPGVAGSYALGHVAIVEGILPDGRIRTSNLNWGATPTQVTSVDMVPGPGFRFVHL